MPNIRRAIDIGQLRIFDLIRMVEDRQASAAPSLMPGGKASIDIAVRSIITSSLKSSPLSRFEVAANMSDTLNVEITKAQLDSWSAESKEGHRFPLVYTAAFCQATGNYTLVRYIAELCGGYFIEGGDAIDLTLGRIEKEIRKLEGKRSALREIRGHGQEG